MLCHHQALLSGQRCFFKHNCGRLFAGTLQRVRSSVIRKTRTITAASSSSSSSTTMTTGKLASLQPQPLFSLFEQVTQVPRPSFHEDRCVEMESTRRTVIKRTHVHNTHTAFCNGSRTGQMHVASHGVKMKHATLLLFGQDRGVGSRHP